MCLVVMWAQCENTDWKLRGANAQSGQEVPHPTLSVNIL